MDAWARCYAPWTRIKAVVVSKATGICTVQTLSSVVHAGKGRKPGCAVCPNSNNSALFTSKLLLCCRKHQLNTVQPVTLEAPIIIDSHDIGIRMTASGFSL